MSRRAGQLLACLCLLVRALPPAVAAGPDPLFTFGAVADIQYADKETKGKRQYRRSLELLHPCVDKFNAEKPVFVVQCGDLYDGYGKDRPGQAQADALRVLPVLRGVAAPLYHVVGNHCLTAGREFVARELKMERFHYEFASPSAKGWRFLVLDGNDAGYGVMSSGQIEWLGRRLAAAKASGERAILFCHYPLLKEAAPNHRLQNPEAVLAVIEGAGCAAAWIAGHDHAGGYGLRAGIHHVTLAGFCESTAGPSFAFFSVFPNRIVEDGFGDEPDREMPLDTPPK
ncbi:MAG: metallophosphoesterase [Verrucomicrobiae bacterium]|nr:metallophosphoesterase [Verrucomicrobiae bacterium]